MPISNLSVTSTMSQGWQASNTVTGLISPTSNNGKNSPSQTYSTLIANNALGGADEFFNFLLTIAASGTASLDLTAMTNILQQAGVSIARVKSYQFQLVNVAQDPVNGTACSSVAMGAAGSNPQQFNLSTSGTFTVFTGGSWAYQDQVPGGFTIDSTHKILKIVNNDASNGACVRVQVSAGTT